MPWEKRMDEARYGDLLKEIRPRIIETPEEHERLLSIAEKMMEKGEHLSEEERELLALLVLLIEAFESNVLDEDDAEEEEAEEPPAPHVVLQRLMESQGVEFDDVVPIFGNPHVAREVLDGNRPISRGQAKELGHYFRVPPKLFRVEPH
jgi:HTH-type transcriptional regulator/antitoxin HigA